MYTVTYEVFTYASMVLAPKTLGARWILQIRGVKERTNLSSIKWEYLFPRNTKFQVSRLMNK